MAWPTLQNCLDSVREILKDQDSAEYRYSDFEIMRAFNMGLAVLYDRRPEVFPLSTGLTTYTLWDQVDNFPLPVQFFQPLVFFTAGMAELRNDEFTDDSRATKLINKFELDVTGGIGGTN